MNTRPPRDLPTIDRYEIRLNGRLNARWDGWFEGFTLTNEADGTSTLIGDLSDQAALHGALRRVSDLGIELISVNAITISSPSEFELRSTQ